MTPQSPVMMALQRKVARSENVTKRTRPVLVLMFHPRQAAQKEGKAVSLKVTCAWIRYVCSDIDVGPSAEECEEKILSDEGVKSTNCLALFSYPLDS